MRDGVVFLTVPRHTPIIRLLAALVFLAMGAAQLFGMHRGYLCECDGETRMVNTPYCITPHEDDVRDEGRASETEQEHHGDEERKSHDAVRDVLQSSPAPVVAVSVPPPVMLFTLPDFLFLPTPVVLSATQYHADVSCAPPPGVVLERTVVLLI